MPQWTSLISSVSSIAPFTYSCDEYNRCIKQEVAEEGDEKSMSLGSCKLKCGVNSVLWPLPRQFSKGDGVTGFELDSVDFTNKGELKATETAELLQKHIDEQVEWVKAKKRNTYALKPKGVLFSINVHLSKDKVRTVVSSYSIKYPMWSNRQNRVPIKSPSLFRKRLRSQLLART